MRTHTITAGEDSRSGKSVYYIDGSPTDIEADLITAGSDSDAIFRRVEHLIEGDVLTIEHDREYIHVTTDEPSEGEAAE